MSFCWPVRQYRSRCFRWIIRIFSPFEGKRFQFYPTFFEICCQALWFTYRSFGYLSGVNCTSMPKCYFFRFQYFPVLFDLPWPWIDAPKLVQMCWSYLPNFLCLWFPRTDFSWTPQEKLSAESYFYCFSQEPGPYAKIQSFCPPTHALFSVLPQSTCENCLLSPPLGSASSKIDSQESSKDPFWWIYLAPAGLLLFFLVNDQSIYRCVFHARCWECRQ